MLKIFFHLAPDDEGYPPVSAESVWASVLPDGRHRVENIPFYAVGVALGDVVECEEDPHGYRWVKAVSQPSGHGTLRVVVHDRADLNELTQRLESMGCSWEGGDIPNLIAVDVPRSVSYPAIVELAAILG